MSMEAERRIHQLPPEWIIEVWSDDTVWVRTEDGNHRVTLLEHLTGYQPKPRPDPADARLAALTQVAEAAQRAHKLLRQNMTLSDIQKILEQDTQAFDLLNDALAALVAAGYAPDEKDATT